MAISVRKLKSVEELPKFKTILSGSGELDHFKISGNDAQSFIVLTSKNKDDFDFDKVRTGKSNIEIIVVIGHDVLESKKRNILIRSFIKRINSIKGFYVYKDTIFSVPSADIKNMYDQKESIENNEGVKRIKKLNEIEDIDHTDVDDTNAINNFYSVCERAFKEGASDIHFLLNVDANICEIQFRINSELEVVDRVPYARGIEMVRAAYSSKADPDSRSDTSFNEKKRQDCRIVLMFGNNKVGFRYASSPQADGTNVVLRLLPIGVEDEKNPELEDLGFLPSQARMIESIMRKPIGAFIVSGVTGSGKSTTLKTVLRQKIDDNPNKKVVTIEQPVEYSIKGAVQIPVTKNSATEENPFAGTIKAAMRLDPDTVMIGEVRDEVSSELLASATESGHSVVTTVHASSALEIITRLTGQAMKLPVDTVASISFISGLVYQKLVPMLCDHCKKPLNVEEFENSGDHYKEGLVNRLKRVVDLHENTIYLRHDEGCEHCRKGVKGIEVCAEVVMPDLRMRSYWKEMNDVAAYEYWRSTKDPEDPTNGQGRTALDVAIYKMSLGKACPINLEKLFGNIDEEVVLEDGVRSYKEV